MVIISDSCLPLNLIVVSEKDMFHLFSDIFACRDNALTHLDPRAKLVVGLASIIMIIMSTRIELPLTILAVCLITLPILRIPIRLVMARLAAPFGTVLILIVLHSFTIGSTPIFSITVMSWHGTMMREGLIHGLMLGLHVLGAVSIILLLSSVTPVHKILQALRWFRISKGWIEIAMLMYRYTFTLLEHADDVAAAQKMRLGYRGVNRSLSSMGALAGVVIIRSLDQSAATHQAMTLRGYTGVTPCGPLSAMNARDRWVMILMLFVVSAAYALLEWRII